MSHATDDLTMQMVEARLRSLVLEIQLEAKARHRDHRSASRVRAGMHEASILLQERLTEMFGTRERTEAS